MKRAAYCLLTLLLIVFFSAFFIRLSAPRQAKETGENQSTRDADVIVVSADSASNNAVSGDAGDASGEASTAATTAALPYSGEHADESKEIYEAQCQDPDFVTLAFAGDVSFADDYAASQNYTRGGISAAFNSELQKTMQTADIFMVNNEFCYSTRGTAAVGKTYTFRADPSRVQRLNEMGVDIVSIANNHAYDYGADAFCDTLDTLRENHTPYVGGGVNLADAKGHIVYYLANGIKIGYIAATAIEYNGEYTKEATADTPGVIRCQDPSLVNEMIAEAKKNCDFVIVYPHWGIEYQEQFDVSQQQLAHSFIDAGADAVIGGHPHCLQGVEYYRDVPIFYSLSNFSFSGKLIDSMVLELSINQNGIQQAQVIPCMEKYGYTEQLSKDSSDYSRILELLNRVSENASIDDQGVVTQTP